PFNPLAISLMSQFQGEGDIMNAPETGIAPGGGAGLTPNMAEEIRKRRLMKMLQDLAQQRDAMGQGKQPQGPGQFAGGFGQGMQQGSSLANILQQVGLGGSLSGLLG